jgi:hypothetical protein
MSAARVRWAAELNSTTPEKDMKCPICADETAGQETQQWGPEWAHVRCVKAYSLGGCDARADLREKLERLQAIEAAARNLVKVKGRYHTEQAFKTLQDALGDGK